jgi:sulfur carrier protein
MHPTRLNSIGTPMPPHSEESTGKSTSHRTDKARDLSVRVNDKSLSVAGGTTLSQLLDELGLTGRVGLAVAVNDAVVPRSGWPTRRLADGDQVLVIQATQGG